MSSCHCGGRLDALCGKGTTESTGGCPGVCYMGISFARVSQEGEKWGGRSLACSTPHQLCIHCQFVTIEVAPPPSSTQCFACSPSCWREGIEVQAGRQARRQGCKCVARLTTEAVAVVSGCCRSGGGSGGVVVVVGTGECLRRPCGAAVALWAGTVEVGGAGVSSNLEHGFVSVGPCGHLRLLVR